MASSQSPAEEFATLAHEIAHEMMHRDERRRSTTKRVRETEAEAVAFVVCSAIGLEIGSAAQDYIGLYGGDAKLLSESLEYIQRAASQILNAIGAEKSAAPPASCGSSYSPSTPSTTLSISPPCGGSHGSRPCRSVI